MIKYKQKKYYKRKQKKKRKIIYHKKKHIYGKGFKRDLNNLNISKNYEKHIQEIKSHIIIIKKSKLTNNIIQLPYDIQMKIYIFTMKKFNRYFIPKISQVPSWYKHKIYVMKELWKSQSLMIHFLHLDFNTLPENKKYIFGCQCDYCLSQHEIISEDKFWDYYLYNISEPLSQNENHYGINELQEIYEMKLVNYFLYDVKMFHPNIKHEPIYFSNDTINQYSP